MSKQTANDVDAVIAAAGPLPAVPPAMNAPITRKSTSEHRHDPPTNPSQAPDVSAIEALQTEDKTTRSNLRLYTIFIALCFVLFIGALDQTIVATAIPSITSDLRSASGYTWIGSAYLLATAAAGPIWVKCSDIWGRKPIILVSVTLFAVASILIATAKDMPTLIAGRALQGVAAGGSMQLVSVTMSDIFSLRKRALYMSALGLVWMGAGTMGPIIGGALSEYASWRWCFWINVPVCVVASVVLLVYLDVHNPRTKLRDGVKAVDWVGTFAILAVTLMLLLGLDFGGVVYAWDNPKVVCLVVLGTAMIGFFIYSEMRLARYPLMPLGIFRELGNNAVVLVAFTHSMASFGAEYYLPLYFQSVRQASPLTSGLLVLPLMITCAVVEISSGVLIHQIGRYRELIWAGTALLTLGTGLYVLFGVDTSLGTIIGFQIVAGIGMSLLFQTPTLALQSNVSQADTASAISTLNFMRNLATSLSTVIGGAVFQNGMNTRRSMLAVAGLGKDDLDALSGYSAAANVEIVRHLDDPLQRRAVQEAFSWSIRNMFILYTCIGAVGLLASMFVKQRHMSKEHTETKTGIQHMTEQKKASDRRDDVAA